MSPSERAAVDQAHRQFGEPTATPKPRSGEHTPESDEASDRCCECGLEFVDLSVSRKLESERNLLKIEMRDYVDNATFSRCNGLRLDAEAERDLLRERELELVAMLIYWMPASEPLQDQHDELSENHKKTWHKTRALIAEHGR